MKKLVPAPLVLFDASVIIAGLRSPKGGSAKLLNFAKQKKIFALVTNIIVNEVLKHQAKVSLNHKQIIEFCEKTFRVFSEPSRESVNFYSAIVGDPGDAHVLTSARETNAHFLVTLDKKHLLSLKNKIKDFQIVTPGELIAILA